MKKYFLTLLIATIGFTSCQNGSQKKTAPAEKTTEKTDSLKVLRGEFIYVDNAAVLKGPDYVYGVKIDSAAKKLAQKTDSLKRDEFDMVPVVLKGTIKQNEQEEGWDEIVTIKEVLKVSEPVSDPAIRIENEGQKEE